MSTSRGSFVHVHVGQGLLIQHVWMPSSGLFDSLDAINGIECLHMPVELTDVQACWSAEHPASMLWYVMVRRAHSLAAGTAPVQCAWRGCLLQLPPKAAAVAKSNTACE